MNKKKNKIKIVCILIVFLIMNCLNIINSVHASNLITSADLKNEGDCGSLLKYKGSIVIVTYVSYLNNNTYYPAYCLNKNLPGVGTVDEYTVTVDDIITDVGLWKTIINGYPYKSLEELGVANKQEAFTATKQALYCYIHGNNPNDYEPIGEAGLRTLNAMKKILNDANASKEVQISSTININKDSKTWQQDSIDKNYISKTYSVSAGTNIDDYSVNLSKGNKELIEGIKIVDEQNKEKKQFSSKEKFKVIIPISYIKEAGDFKINVEASLKTKPILYGKAPNSSLQDYVLTMVEYEDGTGNTLDNYAKNDTQIKIIKQEKDTKEKLEGVEFSLLDENKNPVHSNLKTNKDGEVLIQNLMPGTYYLKEVNTKDGYLLYQEEIKITVKYNEMVTVTVNNTKNEEPEVEKTKKQLEVHAQEVNNVQTQKIETESIQSQIKKLPVTGY